MHKHFFTLALLMSAATYAQDDKGIHFEHADSWQAIQAKAKAENKFIFMDAFTTWCGPCKAMAKNIFPLPEVGDFFNANYISLKVQLDTTAKDNDAVKSWYADAHAIMKNYKVNVFPTYLFFSPDGKLVHRAVGSSEAAAFIEKGKDALDPNKQYFTLAAKYDAGERDPAFLKAVAEASLNAYDREKIAFYSNAYLATQKDMLTPENIKFIDDFTQSGKDAGFDIIAKNQTAYDKVMGTGKAAQKIKGIILEEKVYPKLFGSEDAPDWKKIQTTVAAEYPELSDEIIANAKVVYYNSKGDWPEFSKAVTAYISKYGDNTSGEELNNYAWQIFENCDDMTCVNQALDWSKKSVDLTNNPMFMDTYANLLYRTGKNEMAIEWEQKALNIVKENKTDDPASYETTLEKMKKGEKTW